MDKIIVVGIKDLKIFESLEKIKESTSQNITYECFIDFITAVNKIPEPIKKGREEMEELGHALTALTFGKQKVVINEIPQVNPHERKYKNKRKW
ncbi:MAG TPA: hypothetical protein DCQ50_14645 [Chryseobacterium sp.]|nr:hypothetical protein [Chryseobacterium sp.]